MIKKKQKDQAIMLETFMMGIQDLVGIENSLREINDRNVPSIEWKHTNHDVVRMITLITAGKMVIKVLWPLMEHYIHELSDQDITRQHKEVVTMFLSETSLIQRMHKQLLEEGS